MREFNLKLRRDTKSNFQSLLVKKKNLVDHSITSLHSYNLLDHPDYINSKKIEKRIVRYYKAKTIRKAKSGYLPRTFNDLE